MTTRVTFHANTIEFSTGTVTILHLALVLQPSGIRALPSGKVRATRDTLRPAADSRPSFLELCFGLGATTMQVIGEHCAAAC